MQLQSCTACDDPNLELCEECSFIDGHECIKTKVTEPSVSLSVWEAHDKDDFGVQRSNCRMAEEFRKNPEKNSTRGTHCDGY